MLLLRITILNDENKPDFGKGIHHGELAVNTLMAHEVTKPTHLPTQKGQ